MSFTKLEMGTSCNNSLRLVCLLLLFVCLFFFCFFFCAGFTITTPNKFAAV